MDVTKLQLIEKYLVDAGIAKSRYAQVTASLMKRSRAFVERYVTSRVETP